MIVLALLAGAPGTGKYDCGAYITLFRWQQSPASYYIRLYLP